MGEDLSEEYKWRHKLSSVLNIKFHYEEAVPPLTGNSLSEPRLAVPCLRHPGSRTDRCCSPRLNEGSLAELTFGVHLPHCYGTGLAQPSVHSERAASIIHALSGPGKLSICSADLERILRGSLYF